MKGFVFFPRIFVSSDSVAWKIFSRDLNSLNNSLAVFGPMLGNPSKINCCCSFFDLISFEARRDISFGDLFARTDIRRAVDFSFLEKRIGI